MTSRYWLHDFSIGRVVVSSQPLKRGLWLEAKDPDKDEASHYSVTPPRPSMSPFLGQQPRWGVR